MAIYFSPTITALIPIAAVAMTLKISFIAVAVLKGLFLTANLISVYMVWYCSYKGLEGVSQIVNMERQSLF